MVYFECVLLANLVLLRWTHNFTGWGELFIFVQLISFFTFVWLDSILLTNGAIAYFYDEFMSSWTAWLGVFLIGCTVLVEKTVWDIYSIIKAKQGSAKDSQVANLKSLPTVEDQTNRSASPVPLLLINQDLGSGRSGGPASSNRGPPTMREYEKFNREEIELSKLSD